VECAAHPDRNAVGPCASCDKQLCDACATFESDGAWCCEPCGRRQEDDARELGSGLLALVGVGYLATVALGIVLFKARPFVGVLAAIVAIGLGRTLQMLVRARHLAPPRRRRSADLSLRQTGMRSTPRRSG
jgi:hypothetical protein